MNSNDYGSKKAADNMDLFRIEGRTLREYLGDAPKVIIPEGVEVVSECTFPKGTVSIEYPSTLKAIKSVSYYSCHKTLEEIRFHGSPFYDGLSMGSYWGSGYHLLMSFEENGQLYSVAYNFDTEFNVSATERSPRFESPDFSWSQNDEKALSMGSGVVVRSAVYRLNHPVELTEEHKKAYITVLKKHLRELVATAEIENKPDFVRLLDEYKLIDNSNQRLLNTLLETSQVETVRGLLSMREGAATSDSASKTPDEVASSLFESAGGTAEWKKRKLTGVDSIKVALKTGKEAPKELIRGIILKYASFAQVERFAFAPEADRAAELVRTDSLRSALEKMEKSMDLLQNPMLIPTICRFGSASQIKRLLNNGKLWNDWKKSGQRGRNAWRILDGAIMLSDSHEAAIYAQKTGRLESYAQLRSLDETEATLKYLLDFGFDNDGVKRYDLGNTIVEARLGADLKVELLNATTGKSIKLIPKKDIKPDLQRAAADDVSDMRANIKNATKIISAKLMQDFLNGTAASTKEWKATYLENYLMRRVAELLVWFQGGKTFMLTSNGIIGTTGAPFELSNDDVYLAHPLKMCAEDIEVWQDYILRNGLKQPFLQMWEPIHAPESIKSNRYDGIALPTRYLFQKAAHGIKLRFDNLSIKDCSLDYKFDFQNNESLVVFGNLTFDRYTYWTNHVIGFLDRMLARGRIAKDDPTVVEVLDQFTLAQILDFIDLAIQHNSTSCSAALMNYKNEHYPNTAFISTLTLEDLN